MFKQPIETFDAAMDKMLFLKEKLWHLPSL
jgi:hypothetical protein